MCLIAPTPYNLSGSTKKSHLSETDHYDSDPVYSGWMKPLNDRNKGLDVKQREIVKITSAKSKNSGWQKNKVKKIQLSKNPTFRPPSVLQERVSVVRKLHFFCFLPHKRLQYSLNSFSNEKRWTLFIMCGLITSESSDLNGGRLARQLYCNRAVWKHQSFVHSSVK